MRLIHLVTCVEGAGRRSWPPVPERVANKTERGSTRERRVLQQEIDTADTQPRASDMHSGHGRVGDSLLDASSRVSGSFCIMLNNGTGAIVPDERDRVYK